MARSNIRARFVALLLVIPLALLLTAQAQGQTPGLEVMYTKLEPKEQFKYKIKGKEASSSAGVFRWEVPQTEFGTNGFDRNFTGYCAEVQVPITADKLYRFKIGSIDAPTNYSVDASAEPEKAAQRRASLVRELFGRHYRDALTRQVDPDEAVGFQIALWELIQESEPAEGAAKFDLFGGDFQADYPKDQAPASVQKAQGYLNSLTGDDTLFYQNPDTRGRELIRLQGIPNAEGVTAQSQFALRYAGGGGVGSGGASRPLTSFGSPFFGSPGGAFGAGGGGLLAGAGGGGGSSPTSSAATPPTTSPVTTSPVTTSTTPSNSPETTTTTEKTPTGGSETPETPEKPKLPPGTPTQFSTNPVPAPPSILLAVVALGTIGSWRLRVRLRSAK